MIAMIDLLRTGSAKKLISLQDMWPKSSSVNAAHLLKKSAKMII